MELKLSRKEHEIIEKAERVGKLKKEYEKKLETLLEKERFIRTENRREFADLISGFSSRLEKSVMEIKEEGASRKSIKKAKDEIEKIKEWQQYRATLAMEQKIEARQVAEVPGVEISTE